MKEDKLGPYFDKIEKTAGISRDGENLFAGKGSSEYPTPEMKKHLY